MPAQWASLVEQRILPAYGRAQPVLTRDDLTSDQLKAELDAAMQEMQRLVMTLTPELQDWTVRTEAWQRNAFAAAVKGQIGTDVFPFLHGADAETEMRAALERNVALIRGLSDTAAKDVQHLVWDGVAKLTPRDELGAAIADRMGIARNRADFIAADQTVKLSSDLNRLRQQQAGIEEYIWRHSFKLHPRPEHVARDGKIFSWADPPSDGPPGSLPNCGCTAQAYIDLGAEPSAGSEPAQAPHEAGPDITALAGLPAEQFQASTAPAGSWPWSPELPRDLGADRLLVEDVGSILDIAPTIGQSEEDIRAAAARLMAPLPNHVMDVSVASRGGSIVFDASSPRGVIFVRRLVPGSAPDDAALTAVHEIFELPKSMQGAGTAKAMLRSALPLYDQLGVTRIELHANIDVGGYAWARLGFVPKRPDKVRAFLIARLTTLEDAGQLAPQAATAVRQVLTTASDSDFMFDLTQLRGSNGENLGKAILLNTDWEGYLDLTSPAQRARVAAQVAP